MIGWVNPLLVLLLAQQLPQTMAIASGLLGGLLQQVTCDMVETQTAIETWRQRSVNYIAEQTKYWSTSCSLLTPSCIILPQNEDEVAAVVSILRNNNETFAIKSGGHNPNNYFGSIDGGPLISTKKLSEVILDRETETIRIGPGNRWDDVSGALDGTGYIAVGGRVGNVGVGGSMLGGGLSYMSTQYGWAMNSVLEYTIVLANASIVKIRTDNYPEIYTALTTGVNNYGIVTSFLVKARPQGDVWGGNLIFVKTPETTAKLLSAVRNFTENYPDEKAGVILSATRAIAALIDIWIMSIYYNGPEPPEGLFDVFTSAGVLKTNTCKTQSYHSLMTSSNAGVLKGQVYTISTEMIALPYAGECGDKVMQSLYDMWVRVSDKVQHVPGLVASMAWEPLPKAFGRASAKYRPGDDMYDLDDDVDRLMFEVNYSFLHDSDYAEVDAAIRETYEGIRRIGDEASAAGLAPSSDYMPLFESSCFYAQDFYGRLKPEKKALAERVRDELDPEGLWRDRTGGYKIN